MGIGGLIPFLKNASREVSLRNFSGATVAIDTYCWLHKGAYSCSDKIVRGEPTDGYVQYCVKRLNMLKRYGLKPIMVFDGQSLPAKSVTEAKRRESRESARKKAKILLREGKVKEARDFFQRCIDITPEMAHEVFKACTEMGIDCIVAPYEADSQLSYLCKEGLAHIIISEDSDLMLFGCERVLYKMDNNGTGLLIEKSRLNLCFGQKTSSFTFQKFRYMCILSGCDYLPSLPGIGLKKACKFFSLVTNTDIKYVLSKLPTYLKLPNLPLTADYIADFIRADNTFLYQLVFCPRARKLVPLNPYPNGMDPNEMDYAGKYFLDDTAYRLASGQLNCKDLKPFSNSVIAKHGTNSIWNKDYQPKHLETMPEPTITKAVSPPKKTNKPVSGNQDRSASKIVPKELTESEIFQLYANDESSKKRKYSETENINDTNKTEPQGVLSEICSNSESPHVAKVVIKSRFFKKETSKAPTTPQPAESKLSLESIDDNFQLSQPPPDVKIRSHISPFLKKPNKNVSYFDVIERKYGNSEDSVIKLPDLGLTTLPAESQTFHSSNKLDTNILKKTPDCLEPQLPDPKPKSISIKERLGIFGWNKSLTPVGNSVEISPAARQSFKPLCIQKSDGNLLKMRGDSVQSSLNDSTPDSEKDSINNSIQISLNSSGHSVLSDDEDEPHLVYKQKGAYTKLLTPNKGTRKVLSKPNSKSVKSKLNQSINQPSIQECLNRFAYKKRCS